MPPLWSYFASPSLHPLPSTTREDLSHLHAAIGEALENAGDANGALESYRRALDLREALGAEDQNNASNRRLIADATLRSSLPSDREKKGRR